MGRGAVGLARAVDAAAVGARAAGGDQALSQRFSRAEDADGGVRARDAVVVRERFHCRAVDLDALQRLGVLGLEAAGHAQHAFADVRRAGLDGLDAIVDLGGQRRERATLGRTAPVAIDDRIAQRAIKPRDDGVFVTQGIGSSDRVLERRVHQVLGDGAVVHASLDERDELGMTRGQDGRDRRGDRRGHAPRRPTLRGPGQGAAKRDCAKRAENGT